MSYLFKFQTIYKAILSYELKCRKNTESKNLKVVKRIIVSWNCAVCGSKKSKFVKGQEASWLLASSHYILT